MDPLIADLLMRIQRLEQQVQSQQMVIDRFTMTAERPETQVADTNQNPFVMRNRAQKEREAETSEQSQAPPELNPESDPPPRSSQTWPQGNYTPEQKQEMAYQRIAQAQGMTPQERVTARAQARQDARQARMRQSGMTPHEDRIPEQFRGTWTVEGERSPTLTEEGPPQGPAAVPQRNQVPPPAGDTAHTETPQFANRIAQVTESMSHVIEMAVQRLGMVQNRLENLEAKIDEKDHT